MPVQFNPLPSCPALPCPLPSYPVQPCPLPSFSIRFYALLPSLLLSSLLFFYSSPMPCLVLYCPVLSYRTTRSRMVDTDVYMSVYRTSCVLYIMCTCLCTVHRVYVSAYRTSCVRVCVLYCKSCAHVCSLHCTSCVRVCVIVRTCLSTARYIMCKWENFTAVH
jgi:hypothetical protein